MKLLTYSTNNKPLRLGILVDENTIVDPQEAYIELLNQNGQQRAKEIATALLPANPTEFIANGDMALKTAKEAVSYALESAAQSSVLYKKENVQIGAPVLKPNKIICVGLNYKNHILEMKRDFPVHPVIFAKFATAISGPNDTFPLNSQLTKKLDYEAELAFVIGKEGKDIPYEDALDYVFGYTVANDITARDMQKRTIQWLQGKTLDKSLPLGPVLVTKDEIPDPHGLDICLTVNDELRQKSNTEQLLFNVNHLVEFLSGIVTLEPGDIILTGTPGGVGEAQNKFLKHGDKVRVEISGIGAIETTIMEVTES
ncbi:2-hydroxyhepta-2,4-diene-1,7-dioate isomerase [Bacillus sp. AFS076308]|uniref:fumarylacetoacetate hydrolase family protein n=1 Tax=unclassified Bacillus (in: firmicutes) TaxID=185979 RepID=UPI000BF7EA31|nr:MULTISPECIES: fumarylacetoacetate hydrolase family protein [unclassified Bacillus (in: firmicutes)]PFO06284.1 2-hydroxyhepta-2,4-diene-1,7-dioate isomerase [Bacillus sp. AFS076308]PGV53858.1 2-hydroxyhepta-2,4-diene-1,7-dioate isomerase [Bacillus sp. AFS037270]